ncbi:S-adenosyl-L-methionine-dependent methyltransferases superfamily protein [Tasmannia lanceolata]|uniref:S-adenosyl-L-methionine-dependent methyltransferases superfamily protein n=1 Tax=Tasmannia lanceolata TaxID=3420 RepID=UPI004063DACB
MENTSRSLPSRASLRWAILRKSLLPLRGQPDNLYQMGMAYISRKTVHGFNLIPCQLQNGQAREELVAFLEVKDLDGLRDAFLSYSLPIDRSPRLLLIQRVENHVDLNDFEICKKYDVDNTGLVCHWPSEEVLAYFCLTHADMFRSKRILELGSGYGLAGLTIAAGTDAFEVVISDGNPQVVDYIQRNICANSGVFGDTKVESMTLHWNQEQESNILNTFDVIVASDCTFFKEFHEGLALTVKSLLKHSETSKALFFSPRRGNSLDRFLEKIKEIGLSYNVVENYDSKVWKLHTNFLTDDDSSWPNYDKDHCYPILVSITF